MDLTRKRLERGYCPASHKPTATGDEGLCPTGVYGVCQDSFEDFGVNGLIRLQSIGYLSSRYHAKLITCRLLDFAFFSL